MAALSHRRLPAAQSNAPIGPLFTNFGESTRTEFIAAIRPICETMHGIFLHGYIARLEAYHDHSILKATEDGN